jgi:hypothetical protein
MTLSELRTAVIKYAAGFDAALITPRDAAQVVRDAATIEKAIAKVKSLAAARVADTELWREHGDRAPAHWMARQTGTTVTHAHDVLTTARRLEELPQTARAARRGERSAQAGVASCSGGLGEPRGAAAAAPTSGGRLVR